jgi:hypothetical protein
MGAGIARYCDAGRDERPVLMILVRPEPPPIPHGYDDRDGMIILALHLSQALAALH